MKKWFKFTALISILPVGVISSCGEKCDHVGDELLSIESHNSKDIDRTGIFKCSKCGKSFYQTIQPKDVNMPIINIKGNLDDVTGDDKKKMELEFLSVDNIQDFDVDIEIKLQGYSSKDFPKKNYNITLYKTGTQDRQKIKFEDWPKMSKFTLKADWTDCRHVRNLGLAQLWGNIIHSQERHGDDDILFDSVNGGATDGFPIILYNNNEFWGLYEMTIPKGKNLAAMEDDDGSGSIHHALFCAEQNWPSNYLQVQIDKNQSLEQQGWDLQHNSIDGEDGWVIDAFNELIQFVNESSDDEFKNEVSNYVDFNRTIDFMCFTDMLDMEDNQAKNINWATYDGKKWTPLLWDMDFSFGYDWLGNPNYKPFDNPLDFTTSNRLFSRLYTNFKNDYLARFSQMRQTFFQPNNIINTLFDFYLKINPKCFAPDFDAWPETPDQNEEFFYHLYNYINNRWNWLESQ